jgi:transglutaminase-like putative cysteine protease
MALASLQSGGLVFGVAMSCVTVAAHWFSWRRRGRKSRLLTGILALVMLSILITFIGLFSSGVLDSLTAVSDIFVSLGVIQSFYLPNRKDVEDAFIAPWLTIVAAAAYSLDMSFALFLMVFFGFFLLSLIFNQVEERRQAAGLTPLPAGEPQRVVKAAIPVLAIVLAGAALFFLAIPRNLELKTRTYPVSAPTSSQTDLGGAIYNPAYPNLSPLTPDGGQPEDGGTRRDPFNPAGYYGLGASLDLNYRGRLSSEVILKVRSAETAYWRGLVFDQYTGREWKMSDQQTKRISAKANIVSLPPAQDNAVPYEDYFRLIHTFHLLKDGSNAVFAAYEPVELYFPEDHVYYDRYGSVRAPGPLQQGTVYSVISYRRPWTPADLREAGEQYPPQILEQYLQLPDMPRRVQEMSLGLTANHNNTYDKAIAIYSHLINSYDYDLDVPPQTDDSDTVDWFLFEQQAGFCEHFASSMVVMLRSIGVPARLVTGYAPGSYNPFTGYFEVRGSDAHAWADVYFPQYGWVAFDPTPGGTITESPGDRHVWVFSQIAPYLGSELGLAALGTILSNLWNNLAGSLGTLGFLWIIIPGVVALTAFLALATLLVRRRTRETTSSRPHEEGEGNQAVVFALYDEMCQLLANLGIHRSISQTPAEFAAAARSRRELPAIDELSQLRSLAAYGPEPITVHQVELAHRSLQGLKEELAQE